MSTRVRTTLAAISIAGVLIAGLAPAGTPGLGAAETSAASMTPSATGPCVAGWAEQPVPTSAFESTPFEIVTRGGKPAWIVGGSNDGPLVLRWKSTLWKHVAQRPTGHRGFVGAVATGAGRMLAVGYQRGPSFELGPYLGRMSSGSLSIRKPPRPRADRSGLVDVVRLADDELWVVGTRLHRGRFKPLASRWNGSRWSHHPMGAGTGAGLLAVEAAPDRTLWTAGWRDISAGQPKPLIGRWRTGKWQVTRGPGLGKGTGLLTDLTFPANTRGYAVGYHVAGANDHHRAILFRWDGTAWSRVELPWADDFSAVPRAVSANTAGEIWIGGAQLATASRETRGFIAHFAEGEWDVDVLGLPQDVRSEVTDVAVIAGGAIATAAVAGTAVVLRSCEPPSVSMAKRRRVAISAIGARLAADEVHIESPLPDLPGTFEPAGEAVQLSSPVPAVRFGLKVRDRTRKAGLNVRTGTYGGFAIDLDGNGRRDVFISRHAGRLPLLFMNRKSGFERVAGSPMFSIVDRHGCDAADVDRSGSKDILCVVGRGQGKQITRHELSTDAGSVDGRLDRSSAGLSDPLGRGRVVEFIHLDSDGWPDVFIGHVPDRDDGLPSLNRFYRNKAGSFVPAHDIGLDNAHGAICSWSGDIDRDGDEDLAYCTVWPIGSRQAGVRLMRNEGGKLVDRTLARGISPMRDLDVAFADVTGDGRRDLVQLSRDRLRVSRFSKSGYVRIWEAAIKDGVALALGDANRDGRADIYVQRGNVRANKPDRLLLSRNRGRNYVSVAIPTTTAGRADKVFSLDYDQNGYADFVILNGGGHIGPVRLLASFPP